MNQELPTWNPEDKEESLKRLATAFNELARFTFLKDGTHVQLAFLVDGNGELGMIPPMAGDPAAFISLVKSQVTARQPFGVIHVAETWAYLRRSPNDHTFTQVALGEIRVSELAQGEKTEALMVRMESSGGTAKIWFSPILRGGAAKVSLADPIVLDPAAGRTLRQFLFLRFPYRSRNPSSAPRNMWA